MIPYVVVFKTKETTTHSLVNNCISVLPTFNVSVDHLILMQMRHALENLVSVTDNNLFVKCSIFTQ